MAVGRKERGGMAKEPLVQAWVRRGCWKKRVSGRERAWS